MSIYKKITAILLACSVCLPVVPAAAEEWGDMDAKAYALIEANTGTVIASAGGEEQMPAAGLTKLMSCLLIYEAIDNKTVSVQDSVRISKEAAAQGGTQVFLDAGAEYTIEELLKPMVMSSANDATVALAESVAGSEAAFVQLMNQRASQMELGASFADCTGLSEASTMSALDAARVAAELSKHSAFFKYSSLWLESFTHKSGRETEMSNANRLVREGCDGMMTGSVGVESYHVAASLASGNARYICVVMGDKSSSDRFKFAKAGVDYGASVYTVKEIARQGAKVTEVKVSGGDTKEAELVASQDLVLLLKKGEDSGMQKEIEAEDLNAPVKAGDEVGMLKIKMAGGEEYSVPLTVKSDISAKSFMTSLARISGEWLKSSDGAA